MKYSLLVLFVVAISVLVLSGVGAEAVSVNDYSDPLLNSDNVCTTTAKGSTIVVSPCRDSSPTGQTRHEISTTSGKLAIIADHDVFISAQQKLTKPVLTKIRGQLMNISEPVYYLDVPKTTVLTQTPSTDACDLGAGKTREKIGMVHANSSKQSLVVCYDSFANGLYSVTKQEYAMTVSFEDVQYYSPMSVSRKKAGDHLAYDLGVSNARIMMSWVAPDQNNWFGRSANKEWYVVSYDGELDADFKGMSATVLDPFFSTDYSSRMSINLTCPLSAVGDQRCFYNDSATITFDSLDLLNRGQAQADGDDIRIVFRNATDDIVQTEIPSYNLTGFSQTNTTLQFKLQNSVRDAVGLVSGVTNYSYYLYWNFGAATIPSYRTDISTVFDHGGLDHNYTNLMMCFDFDNQTAGALDFANNEVVVNRCKNGILGASPVTEIVLNNTVGAIDMGPNVDSIGTSKNITTMRTLGQSASFDGTSARCLITQDSAAFNFANYTLMAWVKMNGSGGASTHAIIDSANNNIMMGKYPSTNRVFCTYNDGGLTADVIASQEYENDIWNFVACTYHNNGTLTAFFGNSTTFAKILSVDGAGDTLNDWAGGFAIGGRPPCTGTGNKWGGLIDDVYIFNASLEYNDIFEIYNRRRLREGGAIAFVYGAHENSTSPPVIVLNSTTVLPNGTLSMALNESRDVMVNVSYDSTANNAGNMSIRWVVNNTNMFNQTVLVATPGVTYQFNLSNTTFGRNATIYFNVSAVDNTSRSATDVTSQNVTVRNIPPGVVTNITLAGSTIIDGLRTRQNFTLNWNQTGDDDDPSSNLGFNTTIGGVGRCGRKNTTTSCQITALAAGSYAYTITTLDGENSTSTSSATLVIDETFPSLDNITNLTVQETSFVLNWTTNEPTNYSVSYGTDCLSFGSTAVGTGFNTSVSRQITGLAGDSTYCYRITVGDNTTSSLGHLSNSSRTYNVTTLANVGSPEQGDILIVGGGGGGGGGGTTVNVEGDFEISPKIVGKFRFVGLGGVVEPFVQDFLVSQKPSSCESLLGLFSCEITSTGVRASMNQSVVSNELVSLSKDTIKVSLQSLQDTSEISVTTINLGVYFETGSTFGLDSSLFASFDAKGNPLGIKIIPIVVVILSLVGLGLLLSSGRTASKFARDVVGGR